ncbi:hypothetical protein KGQ20_33330 [Catenulispora sp. NF23]|uniref:hypothetical protein n=1 Tax=Catenulispora pinistramenti TaxID=2705254 RepID=UPI001BA89743|nr:hypothetical protein [Catenulispora pinistramenti]MBS2537645.1 hypothetical protein [Catenulispora pinistramenti]
MSDMRELLSGALPAPQDEPQHRDVIDDAMDWGTRRRRRDWVLSGAAALAVLAVGTGVAAMSGGSGSTVNAGGGTPSGAQTHRSDASPSGPEGSWWTPYCSASGTVTKDLQKYCELYNEEQNFGIDFAAGSAKYIQAALPAGFTVQPTGKWVLILTGPDGKTNYMFPSAEPASSLDGHQLGCGVPAPSDCVQTSTAGGTVVVAGGPSGEPSAGYVAAGLKDPRVDLILGTSVTGGLNGMAGPTGPVPLLTDAQLAKILTDPGFLGYAKAQVRHLADITEQLQSMAPPSGSWTPSSGASNSESYPPPGGYPSSPPSGNAGSSSLSWPSSPSDSGASTGQSSPSSPSGSGPSSGQSWSSQPLGSGASSSLSTPSSPSGSSSS